MSTPPTQRLLTVEEYLANERTSEVRHEYVGGRLYAMSGASDRHNLIAGNLFALLRAHTRGTPCQLFVSDLKLRLTRGAVEIFYYPDLMLCCDPEDRESYYRRRPCLLVEVLSESTSLTDRREKLLAYTGIETLQAYLLVSQDRPEVTLYRRADNWREQVLTEGDVPIDCLDVRVPVQAIYDEVPGVGTSG